MHVKRSKSDTDIQIVNNGGRSMRLYQVWKGSNKFFLGGRLIFGPDARSILLTISLILIPAILFAIFISKDLVSAFGSERGYLIVSIAVVFAVYDIILLLLTSGRDPGIVPRNEHPPEPEETDSPIISSGWSRNQGGAPILPPTKDVFVNGIVVKVKYCNTCMLYRPPRCSHCSICNNCVERFDHHCPWVGQCIGRRNYRFFFMFISSTTILCLYVFSFCWVNLNKIMVADECHLGKALAKSPVSGILIIYTFIAAWFVGGLTAFHTYLVLTNQTTYENFRYRYDRKLNPYNRGCIQNWNEIIFSGVPKSMNNFRAMVKVNSAASPPQPPGQVRGPDAAKKSFDIEIGGKRFVVATEEFEDMHSKIESTGGLENFRAKAGNLSWGSSRGHWEITHDIESSEFGIQSGIQSLYTDSKDLGNHFR